LATFVEGKWDAKFTHEFQFSVAFSWGSLLLAASDCQDKRPLWGWSDSKQKLACMRRTLNRKARFSF
jgi:hypothetical protein